VARLVKPQRFLEEIAFDLLDQNREIGSVKAHFGSRYPVVFHLRRNMLVMRMGALQMGVVGVRLWVVPVQPLFSLPDLITVTIDAKRQAVEDEPFEDDEPDVVIEVDLTSYTGKRVPTANERQSGVADRGISFPESVQKELVVLGRAERVTHATARMRPFNEGEPPCIL
jgi:hypothetical protein